MKEALAASVVRLVTVALRRLTFNNPHDDIMRVLDR